MRSVISFNSISILKDLYKRDKKICEKFMLFWLIMMLLSNSIMSTLSSINESNNLNLNIWDGVFRILSHPYFMLYIYIPSILILLNPSKLLYQKYFMIRLKSKYRIIINEIIFKIICITIFSFIYIISICILGCLYFKIQATWSVCIMNMEDTAVCSQSIYPNNFTSCFSPYTAIIINFIQVILTVVLMDMIRGLVIDLTGSFKLSNIFISLIILVNVILFNFAISGKIQNILNYFLINNFVLLWDHKFDSMSFSNVTLPESMVVLAVITIIFIVLRIAFCKGMRMIDEY